MTTGTLLTGNGIDDSLYKEKCLKGDFIYGKQSCAMLRKMRRS